MIDIHKMANEHEELFPKADLKSQLIKLDEEVEEAEQAFDKYLKELADVFIVCVGISRFDVDLADEQLKKLYEQVKIYNLDINKIYEYAERKWKINLERPWIWNGKTYKHSKKDGEE